MNYIPKKNDAVVVTALTPYSSDQESGIKVGMVGTVLDNDEEFPNVYFMSIDKTQPMYPSQLRAACAVDVIRAAKKPQPIRSITIREGDVLAILTKYVREEIGIEADVTQITNAFNGALTLAFREVA